MCMSYKKAAASLLLSKSPTSISLVHAYEGQKGKLSNTLPNYHTPVFFSGFTKLIQEEMIIPLQNSPGCSGTWYVSSLSLILYKESAIILSYEPYIVSIRIIFCILFIEKMRSFQLFFQLKRKLFQHIHLLFCYFAENLLILDFAKLIFNSF